MHGREQRSPKYASYTQHVERMHEDVMFWRKHNHEVEGAGNAKHHAIGKTALPDRID